MECPRCGYVLSHFEESCPRCAQAEPHGNKQCPACGAVSAIASKACEVCGYRFSERDIPLPKLYLPSFWQRLLAQVMDGVILFFVFSLLVAYPRARVPVELKEQSILLHPWYPYVAAALIFVVYHSVLVGLGAATPGKKLLGLQVRKTDGKPCSMPRAFLRSAGQVLTLSLGFIGYPLVRWAARRGADVIVAVPDWVGGSIRQDAVEAAVNDLSITLCLWLGALLFLWAIYDRHRRGLHDYMAGTLVIVGKRRSR